MALIASEHNNEDNKEEEDLVVIDNWPKEKLVKEYEILRGNNLILQKRIMQLISPSEDKSEFPEIEDIKATFDTLRKQIFTDVWCKVVAIYLFPSDIWAQVLFLRLFRSSIISQTKLLNNLMKIHSKQMKI